MPPARAGGWFPPPEGRRPKIFEGITYSVILHQKAALQFRNAIMTSRENRDYYYPIPLDEISLNNALTQNPGWENNASNDGN